MTIEELHAEMRLGFDRLYAQVDATLAAVQVLTGEVRRAREDAAVARRMAQDAVSMATEAQAEASAAADVAVAGAPAAVGRPGARRGTQTCAASPTASRRPFS